MNNQKPTPEEIARAIALGSLNDESDCTADEWLDPTDPNGGACIFCERTFPEDARLMARFTMPGAQA
jgi:hypothetical protein